MAASDKTSCTFCSETVTRRFIQAHWRNNCALAPKTIITEKICSRCQTVRGLSEFTDRAALPGGLSHVCSPCKSRITEFSPALSKVAICAFCNEAVSRKRLALHFREGCPSIRPLAEGEHICTRCQVIKQPVDFGSPNKHWCKACGLANYHEYRRRLLTGDVMIAEKPKLRPGRWVLKPCPHCGELFNHQQMLNHKSRCAKKPFTGHTIGQLHEGMVVLTNMEKLRTAFVGRDEKRQQRSRNLLHCYGITLEVYEAMLVAQNGECANCGSIDSGANHGHGWLHIDHDHITGKIRGLLCTACNHLMGNCRDNPAILLRAIAYLAKHNGIGLVS